MYSGMERLRARARRGGAGRVRDLGGTGREAEVDACRVSVGSLSECGVCVI